MTLREKLERLRKLDDVVLYKWMAGGRRIAENFILLSDVRLNVLTCSGGRVVFSSAAPVLYMDKGRPVIQFRDRDIMTIISGPRKGINVFSSMLQEGEDASETRHCEHREVVDESLCPKWLEAKILAMGTSPVLPVAQFRMPELFRISKKPGLLKPIFNSALIRDIGGTREDSLDTLLDKFHDNLDKFGYYTEDGYVISYDYIASGGCCVVASKGITMRTGSCVHQMVAKAFRAECAKRHWKITTTEEDNGNVGRADS